MTTFRPYLLFVLFLSLFLSACGTLWEKDNTPPPSPLVLFTPTIHPRPLWDNRVSYNINHEHLKLSPAVTGTDVVTADPNGTVTVVDKYTGKTRWKPYLQAPLSTGPAVDGDLIVVGSKNGTVIAASIAAKKVLWRISVNSEILATPVISDNIVLIKSIDGNVSAFSAANGQFLWNHAELEPNLILRGSSTPQVSGNAVIIGYASGKILKLSLKNGRELWSQTITTPEGGFAIQRMIDVDANPVIAGNKVFAVTYQGKIAALDFNSGKILWDHNLSSFSGITVDESTVYATDANSDVWAFDRDNGRVAWKQTQMAARHITGPILQGNYLVVGDAQGALHWLKKQDGSFAGRAFSGTSIRANPVAQNNIVYAITQDGYLFAYTL